MNSLVAIAPWIILLYALLVTTGGVVGYVKARSKASLVSGLVSGAALAIAWLLLTQKNSLAYFVGLALATALTVALLIVFFLRFQKTDKFIPAGLLAVLSLILTVILAVDWFILLWAVITIR